MNTNQSTLDRGIRLAIAAAATGGAFSVGASTVLGLILLALAAIMLSTAAVGFCPLYRMLGITTARSSARSTPPSIGAQR